MKALWEKYNRFIEKHCFIASLLMAVVLIASVVFILSNESEVLGVLSLICIISSVTSIVRLNTRNEASLLSMSDSLWRMLRLRKREGEYTVICLKHAKICFLIACISFILNVICFVTVQIVI